MTTSICSSFTGEYARRYVPSVVPSPLSARARRDSGDAAFPILEPIGIKVTYPESCPEGSLWGNYWEKSLDPEVPTFQRCISVTCKSWFCPDCRRVKGFALRDRLTQKAAEFKVPRLYTITVNREWFQSPADAYHYVMDQKFIARLLTKELGVTRWVWVLEAQEENGDGWPHWHILLDVGDLPGAWYCKETQEHQLTPPGSRVGWCWIPHFFDLPKVHRLLRKWKIGEQCYLSVKKEAFINPVHAVRYITKYLIKTPERGFPPWMLNTPGIRFYQPSRVIGSLNDGEAVHAAKLQKPPTETVRIRRLPVDRVAECRCKVVFSHYNKELDRNVISPVMWGIKESLGFFPGAMEKKDFNFETKQEFSILGFEHIKDVQLFNAAWASENFQTWMQERIGQKKQAMLCRWAS